MIDFRFTRTLYNGDRIGFYVYDKSLTAPGISGSNEYDCGNTAANLKSPLLSISPSLEFNSTALPNHNVSASPSRTQSFGGLPQGRYKLCYCRKPAATAKNPLGECRPADYKYSAGVYLFYDAPAVRQRKSVYALKNFNRFLFKIKTLESNSNAYDKQRIVIPDLDASFQTNFETTRGCGQSPTWFPNNPSWSNGAAADETTQRTALSLVQSFHNYDEVAFQLPSTQTSLTATSAGFYSVCLCDVTNIGTGSTSFTSCYSSSTSATMCETKACPASYVAPVEIATVFVSDLSFYSLGKVLSINVQKSSTALTFDFTNPATVFQVTSTFWFARASKSCGTGDHTQATLDMTVPQVWQQSRVSSNTDFSAVGSTSVLVPLRLCLKQRDGSVLDLDHINVVVNEVTVAFGSDSLTDKISDNNQLGLKPATTVYITNSLYQTANSGSTTVTTPKNNQGLWFSDNHVKLTLSWNSSIAPFDEIYAVKSSYPCSVSASYGNYNARSLSFQVPRNLKTATFPLDLGNTLWNSTFINTGAATTLDTAVAPADSTTSANHTLFTEYSLCATCSGCTGFGYEMGLRFRVLAALHIYQETGFEKPHRYSTNNQAIVIASGVVRNSGTSYLFDPNDALWFTDATKPCPSSWVWSGDSSDSVQGNQTVYSKLINAYQYFFDFSSVSQPTGKLFRLCVLRSGFPVMDFQGVAVSILPPTNSPTTTSTYSSFSNTVYGATPSGSQSFVVNSVVTDTAFNTISWKFTGTVEKQDRLSISDPGVGTDTNALSSQCQPHTYSFMTVLASAAGLTAASPATSSSFSGLMPGQYSLCYCSVKVSGATLSACRTSRHFSQFVGFVYFDGRYQRPGLTRSENHAVHVNRPANLYMKVTSGSFLDRIMLAPDGVECGSSAATATSYQTLADTKMSDPTATLVPTAAVTGRTITKGPTRAPSTKSPTAAPTKLPTKAPTRAPTTAPTAPTSTGRRRLLATSAPSTKAPTGAPTTKAPTKAPTTVAPTTKSPTSAPTTLAPSTKVPTESPTKAPITSAPVTKAPVQQNYLGGGSQPYTSSPTINKGSDPYITMSLAAAYTFTVVGRFKVCYCWHNRYSGASSFTTASTIVTATYPTAAPTTGAPTSTAGRRLLQSKTFTMHQHRNDTGSSCYGTDYKWEQRYGVPMGSLIVHDVFLVSTFSSSGTSISTARLAVRAVSNQRIRFKASLSAADMQGSAWWTKYGVPCSDATTTVSTTRVTVADALGTNPTYFNFNSFPRTCSAWGSATTSPRRNNDYASLEEGYFLRLCVLSSNTQKTYDFANVMVTVTDIKVLDGYQNPKAPTPTPSGTAVTVKFNEACGFLWSEQNWRIANYFRFVASGTSCVLETTVTVSATTSTKESGNNGFVQYVMYQASLIKYFLDDADFISSVTFADGFAYHNKYRLCMHVQLETASNYNADLYRDQVVDYPDVALYPVFANVKLAYQDPQHSNIANCPPTLLGCQCNSTLTPTCKANIHRDLDSAAGVTPSCTTSLNLCTAPTRFLYGSFTPSSVTGVCTVPTPCANPGPDSALSDVKVMLQFNSKDLLASDSVRFVKSTDPCDWEVTNSQAATSWMTNLVTDSLVTFATNALAGSAVYRLCVKSSASVDLDFFSTGFTLQGTPATSAPTKHTMKPTTWYNIDNTNTFSPTLLNPSFGGPERYPDIGAPVYNASKLNQLHIVQASTDTAVLYTQWTNFTGAVIKQQDTLRVYRYTTQKTPIERDTVCTENWAKQKLHESNDMVMEVKVTSAGQDSASSGVVNTVNFPSLARGYYTVCFCRYTLSQKCQMTSAGMIYSSAGRAVSSMGSGSNAAKFRVTPELDYEITADLFNTTRSQYITASHFCVSIDLCNSCQWGSDRTNGVLPNPEFKIELTSGASGPTFPLVITNEVAHSGVFHLCFKDPMLLQYHTTVYNTTALRSVVNADKNVSYAFDQWNYALIGTLYLSDLTFQWEMSGGFTPTRTSYSVGSGTVGNIMIKPHYTASSTTVTNTDTYRWTSTQHPCSVEGTVQGASTDSTQFPANTVASYVRFSTVTAGAQYRACVKPFGSSGSTSIRDFGTEYSVWVTDIVPSATTFQFFKSFHLSLTSSVSLQINDEFWLQHIGYQLCSDYSTLKAGYISPNMGVFLNSSAAPYNLGKMPQVVANNAGTPAHSTVLAWAPYRLCVKRSVPDANPLFIDYPGLVFFPQGALHVDQNVVSKTVSTTIKIIGGLKRIENDATVSSNYLKESFALQETDIVWWADKSQSCAKDIWNSASNAIQLGTTASTATRSGVVTLAASHFQNNWGRDVQAAFNFQNSNTGTYRLCVEKLSITKDPTGGTYSPTQNVVLDYSNVQIVLSTALSATNSPTAFTAARGAPTPGATITPASTTQVFSLFTSNSQNSLTWQFTGSTSLNENDKLAVVPTSVSAGPFACDGSSLLADPTLLISAGPRGLSAPNNATTPNFSSLGAGKYLVCFCQASASISGDCSNELGWRAQVGYLYVFAVTQTDVAISRYATSSSSFTLWFDQAVDANYRFLLIDGGNRCGSSAASTKVPNLLYSATTAEIESSTSGVTMTSGLTVTADYKVTASGSASTVGIYHVCLCPFQCTPNQSFGGKVADLVLHDFKLNGGSIISLRKLQGLPTTVNVTIEQTVFTASTDKLWFARNECGDGSHTANANITVVQSLPVSGGHVPLDFTHIVPSMATNKLCVKVATSGKVYTLSTVGFIVTDINLTVVSPVISTAAPIGVSYQTGLEISPTPANRVMFFRHISLTCDSACTGTSTCTISKNQDTSSEVSVQQSYSITRTLLNFDLSALTGVRAYRLCVLDDKTATNPKTFIDFSGIRIYPVPDDTQYRVASAAVLHQDQYSVQFVVPTNGQRYPGQNSETLYFRKYDLPCLDTPPTAADVNTSSAFKYNANGVGVDFAAVNMTSHAFRLCVFTTGAVSLDYSSKQVFLTTLTLGTKFCRPSPTPCTVALAVSQPEGFFATTGAAVQVWFQRQVSGTKCTSTAPSTSSADSSGSSEYSQAAMNQGQVSLNFVSSASGLTNKFRLCAYHPSFARTADFPTISLHVLDLLLAPAYNNAGVPATGYVRAVASELVKVKAADPTIPVGSQTWFQRSSTTCSLPTAASENTTAVFVTNSSLAAGVNMPYDFSKVVVVGTNQIPFRLCYISSSNLIDANTVEVRVVAYTVTPAYITTSTSQRPTITVEPTSAVSISYFAFCRVGAPCPDYNAMTSLVTQSSANCSQRGAGFSPTSPVNLDFANVVSGGELLRLCGVRQNFDAPHDVVDLNPVGVYQGSLTINRKVVDKAASNVEITWSVVLGAVSNTTTDAVWFQNRGDACSASATSASNQVQVKASPFTGNFDFSKVTSGEAKLCASVGGATKEFASSYVAVMSVSLGATSVKAATGQSFTVTYSSVPDLGTNPQAWFSSDPTCAAGVGSTATAKVASISGAVHTFDFSAGTPSTSPWNLCLQANTTTFAVDYASVLVVDVGSLGTTSVSNAADQTLTLTSSVSLQGNDTVWFAESCSSSVKSSSVSFASATSSYKFDFSATAPSLSTKYSLCYTRTSTSAPVQYSSSYVMVVPVNALGGPYLTGQRTLNTGTLSSFVGSSQISFVVDSAPCSTGAYVPATTTTFNFTATGTYRLCVQKTDSTLVDVSSINVVIQDCAAICPTTRAVNGQCDTTTGKCLACTPHFQGDRCDQCAAGYTGANCDQCDTTNFYHCSVASTNSSCGYSDTCAQCTCNNHYDLSAADRCPSNVCVCAMGYSGNACESCSTGYYKTVDNATGTFTCTSCASKCNKHASSCTADTCQCTDNFDPVSNCRFCLAGFILNSTSGVCVSTRSPTMTPTKQPTNVPTTQPPTPAACNQTDSDATQCPIWAKAGYCDATSGYANYMTTSCQKSCCVVAQAQAACSNSMDTSSPQNCSYWSSAGFCNYAQYSSFMAANCSATCCLESTFQATYDKCQPDLYPTASCTDWKAAGYCATSSPYSSFMAGNCATACCAAKAQDNSQYAASCSGWADQGYCCTSSTFYNFMSANCAGTCQQRTQDSTAYANSCSGWASNGYCSTNSTYYGFMKLNCGSTCKFCP